MTATMEPKVRAKGIANLVTNDKTKGEELSKRLLAPNGKGKAKRVEITEPNIRVVAFRIRGLSALVMNRFSFKAMQAIREGQAEGDTNERKKRPPKDFDDLYVQATHTSREGWHGIPAPAFRNAMIRSCTLCGFPMTVAKMSVFVLEDGIDNQDNSPLVRIIKGQPYKTEMIVRNPNSGTPDIRVRPMWDAGWEAIVRIRFDEDQFSLVNVTNLLLRAGMQCGVGEGRPFSKDSCGQGWGTFEIVKGGK